MTPKHIHVIFGGASSERFVSTASAQNILQVLPQADAWFLSKTGSVYLCPREGVIAHQDPFKREFEAELSGAPRFQTVEEALASPEAKDSVIVLALHGQGVEDGVLQAKMEKAGIAFTGSGSKASALAFDKLASKKVAAENGVRTARSLDLNAKDAAQITQILVSAIRQFERVAVKPVADGSSVGLFILDGSANGGRAKIEAAAEAIARGGRPYMIEEFIAGTELTVGVMGNGAEARALPPSEVRLATGNNFDYDAKYLGKGVEELTPARVSPEVTRAAQAVAVTMHKALGCEGYSRTDMIITREGPVYLETNTLPGMTRASFYPQQLAAEGKTIQWFFEAEIARAWKRARG